MAEFKLRLFWFDVQLFFIRVRRWYLNWIIKMCDEILDEEE